MIESPNATSTNALLAPAAVTVVAPAFVDGAAAAVVSLVPEEQPVANITTVTRSASGGEKIAEVGRIRIPL
jgi:hypothetical protein